LFRYICLITRLRTLFNCKYSHCGPVPSQLEYTHRNMKNSGMISGAGCLMQVFVHHYRVPPCFSLTPQTASLPATVSLSSSVAIFSTVPIPTYRAIPLHANPSAVPIPLQCQSPTAVHFLCVSFLATVPIPLQCHSPLQVTPITSPRHSPSHRPVDCIVVMSRISIIIPASPLSPALSLSPVLFVPRQGEDKSPIAGQLPPPRTHTPVERGKPI